MTTMVMDDGDEMREFVKGRMSHLLRRLGDPHLQFKTVHVARTKRKGLTVAFLSSILREERYSVGCYTSPHLLTIRESISIGKHGEHTSTMLLGNLLNKVKDTLDQAMELENGAL